MLLHPICHILFQSYILYDIVEGAKWGSLQLLANHQSQWLHHQRDQTCSNRFTGY